jgi:hypothetical protein
MYLFSFALPFSRGGVTADDPVEFLRLVLGVVRASDSWAELLKNREIRQSLPAHLAFLASEPFWDHLERMRNSYGFERLHVSSSLARNEQSGSDGESESYEYYNIWRKMRAYTYKTDAFHALVEQQSLGSSEGYLQAPHYKGLDPSAEDYDDSANYIVKTMVDCMSDYRSLANGKADEIAAMAEKGNDA